MIPEEFLKPYNPTETEGRIYKDWEEGGYFKPHKRANPDANGRGKFSMVLPPPNVTGVLHLGHAAMVTIEDVMARYARLRGQETLWLPGTDHAAIATQSKVEEIIYKAEGKTRHDLGREEFLTRVNTYAQQSHDTIVKQIKKLGASLDWSREAFTLDEQRGRAVREAFTRLYNGGLIYRGARIVNWDPKMATTVSDDEVDWKEEKAPFYYLKYGPFTIGTARPETKFGDKHVVMHPADPRYANYQHGQKIELEWINGPVTATVIKDEAVDIAFGTGVMTITPAHDAIDFDIAERHKLEREQIIDRSGKLLPIAGEFAGLHIKKARLLLVEKLKEKGLLDKVDENYTHRLAINSRGGGTIEPQIMEQWFIDVNKPFPFPSDKIQGIKKGEAVTFKELMYEVVESGQIKIIPDHFGKTYFHWIDNLRDWCISRQIWYGHRIPVWYRSTDAHGKSDGKSSEVETYVGTTAPAGEGWEQDPDTLDTWFSSGLWTFSTLGWPDHTPDLERFHPTDILETGYDIIFFWVARMILFTGYLLGDVPFKTIYLHGLVRDKDGQKMSKSKGNALNPLTLIEKYGTDALRLALIIGTSPGTDQKISEDKIRGYKHFANKLWNIARFVATSIDDKKHEQTPTPQDQEAIDEFSKLKTEVTSDMDNYRFYLAGEKLYHYTWHTFADKLIEQNKKGLNTGATLNKIFTELLILLHPFTPFVTEEIWRLLGSHTSLIAGEWPKD